MRINKKIKILILIVLVVMVFIVIKLLTGNGIAAEVFMVSTGNVEEYFIEEGYVKSDKLTDVLSNVSSKILSISVAEKDIVNEGDIICILDSSEFEYNILKAQNNMDSYNAQKQNNKLEEQKRIADLQATKTSLLGEYNAYAAQEKDYIANTANSIKQENEDIVSNKELREQNIKLQEIIIEGKKKELEVAQKSAASAQFMFENNLITQNEYDTAINLVDSLQMELDESIQELEVIKSEDPLRPTSLKEEKTYTEYYKSMQATISDRIEDIDMSLANDYSTAMNDYYDSLINEQSIIIRQMNEHIEDCTIRAPVSGKIEKLYITESNYVNSQNAIALIVSGQSNDIEVLVSTDNYSDISVGDIVEMTVMQKSGDIVFSGTIKDIDNKAITKLSALGIEERKFKITIEPENTEVAALYPDFPVDVKFFTYYAENQISIPKAAVFKYNSDMPHPNVNWLDDDGDNGGIKNRDMVWVVENGIFVMQEVEIARELNTSYVIERGLSSDDIIVLEPYAEGIEYGRTFKTAN